MKTEEDSPLWSGNLCIRCFACTNIRSRLFLGGDVLHRHCSWWTKDPYIFGKCRLCGYKGKVSANCHRCRLCVNLRKCSLCPRYRRCLPYCSTCDNFHCVRCQILIRQQMVTELDYMNVIPRLSQDVVNLIRMYAMPCKFHPMEIYPICVNPGCRMQLPATSSHHGYLCRHCYERKRPASMMAVNLESGGEFLKRGCVVMWMLMWGFFMGAW